MNTIDNNELTSKSSKLIKPLSQNDLASGWQLVVPRIKYYTKLNENESGFKKYSNIYRSKINMAQLPPHLWSKVRYQYNGNIKVSDKSHYYYVEKTNVDSELYELNTILQKPYEVKNTDKVIELLNVLKDNDIYGWLVIKANTMYVL